MQMQDDLTKIWGNLGIQFTWFLKELCWQGYVEPLVSGKQTSKQIHCSCDELHHIKRSKESH
jgi:hypothetical protein